MPTLVSPKSKKTTKPLELKAPLEKKSIEKSASPKVVASEKQRTSLQSKLMKKESKNK